MRHAGERWGVRRIPAGWVLAAATLAVSGPAGAQESEPDAGEASEEVPIGLNIDLQFATAYVYQGVSLFALERQSDFTPMAAPGLSWYHEGSGVSVGYWGAFQLAGEGREALIDEGVGNEQDLWIGWDGAFLDEALGVSALLTWFFYPCADEAAAGAAFPSYLQPQLSVGYDVLGWFTAGLEVSFLAATGSELWDYSYAYLRPWIERETAIGESSTLLAGLGFGYKAFVSGPALQDGGLDVTLDLEWSIYEPSGSFYVVPGVHAAWAHFEESGFEDEWVVWGSFRFGVDL